MLNIFFEKMLENVRKIIIVVNRKRLWYVKKSIDGV